MVKDEKSPDKKSEKDTKKEAPVKAQADKEQEKEQEPLNIPEKFQGKSAEEIAKSYLELEKKYGAHSKELEEARKLKQERQVLEQAVARNPELYKQLETEINKMYGRQTADSKETSKEGSGEARKEDSQIAELRRAEENRIITDFQRKFGIDKLDREDREKLMKKVTNQFADLRDPGGNKPISQILADTQISQLPTLLENSYWLVNKDSLVNKGRIPHQDTASIGSIPASSSTKSDSDSGLTEYERKIASKLGVNPEDYLKSKRTIKEEQFKI